MGFDGRYGKRVAFSEGCVRAQTDARAYDLHAGRKRNCLQLKLVGGSWHFAFACTLANQLVVPHVSTNIIKCIHASVQAYMFELVEQTRYVTMYTCTYIYVYMHIYIYTHQITKICTHPYFV